jgi:hypothetical protein
MMKRVVAFGVALVAIAACGGAVDTLSGGSGGSGTSSITGTVAGQPVPSTDTIAIYGTTQLNPAITYAGVVITNRGNTCDRVQRQVGLANEVVLEVVVSRGSDTTTQAGVISPGAYTVGTRTNPAATVEYLVIDARCSARTATQASSGTVTLTQVDSGTVSGSFDATFPNGDHIAGSFSAPVLPRRCVRATRRRTVPDSIVSPKSSRLRISVLLQWGGRDRRVPVAFGRRFAEGIPGARLVVYGSAGHVPMEELPEETARDADAFLASLGGAS